jgi:hypothetical protein
MVVSADYPDVVQVTGGCPDGDCCTAHAVESKAASLKGSYRGHFKQPKRQQLEGVEPEHLQPPYEYEGADDVM